MPFSFSRPDPTPTTGAAPGRALLGIGPARGPADRILHELKLSGYSNAAISVVFVDGPPKPAAETAMQDSDSARSATEIRGVVAWLAGARSVVIPGVTPLIVAGPLAAGFHRTSAGGIAGILIAFGVPEPDAMRYEQRILSGQVLIGVHLEQLDGVTAARDVMSRAGALAITSLEAPTQSTRFSFRAPPLPDVHFGPDIVASR